MDDRRPFELVVGVALLTIIAIGAAWFGLLLMVMPGTRFEGEMGVGRLALQTGVPGVVYGIAAGAGAIGLWQQQAWGWVIGLIVALIGLLAVLAAIVTGEFHPALIIAVILCGGTLAFLVQRGVRESVGIG